MDARIPTTSSDSTAKQTYIVVGVVAAAAAVSAATAGFLFYQRSRRHASVQYLLDRCRNQAQNIETRLKEFA